MKNMIVGLAGMLLVMYAAGFSSLHAKVKGKPVQYRVQGMVMNGYLAYDDSIKDKRPGVLVVHEWWGLNDYAKKRARMLAQLGYTALALDMYGKGKTAVHPDTAKKFSSEVMKNFDTAKARFLAALELLKKQASVDPDRIAAVGYCFGGGVALNMARQGTELKGVVSFHGSLAAVSPAKPGEVKARILVLHGADDKFVTPEQIEAFKKEMTDAGVDFQFISYPGAIHSFTNPGSTAIGKKYKLPLAYNAEADKKSWEEMKKFFDEIFVK
ncbi:MAG: dienelactone hydrolase [Spirochaetes bacterium RBG_16_49_21]|nr:MAG: dienelactone hydrolase [Spirochaetes bacterium RBG_16_49_21]